MDLVNIENFIRELCLRLGEVYSGFHTIGAGRLDGEGCPEVCFHVNGDRSLYTMLVGKDRTVVRISPGETVTYSDLTQEQFFAEGDGEVTGLPFQEVPMTEAELNEFGIYGGQGMRLLGFTDTSDSPEAVIIGLHQYVAEWNPATLNLKTEREFAIIAMCLGIAWGHQLTRELNWEWAVLEKDGVRGYVIVSPDRAYAIHPTGIMSEFLQGTRENNILPLFYWLRAGDFPESVPKSYWRLA